MKPHGTSAPGETSSKLAKAVVISITAITLGICPSATYGDDAGSTPTLVDRAKEAGLSTHHKTWGAVEVDYNLDGRLDVWIGKHYRGGSLWNNAGHGRYHQVRTSAWPRYSAEGKLVDRHDCAWADVDHNGLPDAYCSAGRFNSNFIKRGRDNELWLQGPVGTFRDVGTEWGVGDICSRGRHVAFLHANADRYIDLFVGNEIPRPRADDCNEHPDRLPNEDSKLFINRGGDGFRYAQRMFSFGPGPGSRCAEAIDFDRDGWKDILACGRDDQLWLYRSKRGHGFADVTDRLPAVSVRDATPADIDGDHDSDLIFAAASGFYYTLNTDGYFGPAVLIGEPRTGVGRSVAAGDADLDGDVDVFGSIGTESHGNPNDRLYINTELRFHVLVAPRALGTADDVIAVHPGRNARAEFLVMNGYHGTTNPNIQLIRLVA